jgi:hypothetical protein
MFRVELIEPVSSYPMCYAMFKFSEDAVIYAEALVKNGYTVIVRNNTGVVFREFKPTNPR